jgi:RHS repeat-associated protein
VMMRNSLDATSADAYMLYPSSSYPYYYFYDRGSVGTPAYNQGQSTSYYSLPYWVKVVRSGSSFSGYISPDGSTWTQVGPTETITMASTIDIGLYVNGYSGSGAVTAAFDNVSVVIGTTPIITGLTPVLTGIGSTITVSGSNFGSSQGTSTLSINGTNVTSISSWSDSQIVATVPTGSTTGPVAVTVSTVESLANPVLDIVNPVITAVTPLAAPYSGFVTITGTGFGSGQPELNFNGTYVGAYAWSDTSVSVQVPSPATSGPLTLISQGISSNSVSFTVLGTVSITSASPTVGPVGSSVTITGTNFGATQSSSAVVFNEVPATATSWSNTSITAIVPSGIATGEISVTVAGITAYGPEFDLTAGSQVTDSLGNVTNYTAVVAGGQWSISASDGSGCSTCQVRGVISHTYDDFGNIASTTDARGLTTNYLYDSNHNVTSIQAPTVTAGTPTTTYTYNNFGEVLTETDPLGHVTTKTYDANGNLTSVTTPAPGGTVAASVTHFAYNSLGELTQVTDPLGHVTTMTYTSLGLIHTVTDAQSNVTTYGYDSRGNRTSITDALSHTTSYTYDSMNRLTQVTYPDTTTTSFTYDVRGRRTSVTDQNGKTTTYAFDDGDRLTSITDAATNVTSYGYDTETNLTSITDANSHTTNFTYDAYGRVTQASFPSTHYETYGYDADNNLTSKTDRNANTIDYVYDALNRLTEKDYPDTTKVQYTYDLVGRMTGVTDPSGTYGFTYDNMGRLTGTTATYSFLSGTTFTNAYTYDAASNRTGYTAPDGSTNTYSYDTLNRLTTLANSATGSFGFSYDALSHRTQMSRPNGINTNYTYDNLSRLLSILHQAGTSTIDGDAYTLDSAGNRTAKTDEYASVTSNYTYDALYELTQVTQGSTTTESYVYDGVGNRTASLGVASYTTDSSNEVTANSNASYTYDYNGNTSSMTDSDGTTHYSWDYDNRLTSVTLPASAGTVSFKYDPFGRRVRKISPTTTSVFLYDGPNTVATASGTGGIVARYAETQDVDEPLAESRSGIPSYFERDGLGSVTSLTNSVGSIIRTFTYDSFGQLVGSSGTTTNFFRYTSRDFDTETSLYNYRARYYNPSLGRFISEDPLGIKPDVNAYRYVRNNVVNTTDPSGLCPPLPPPPAPIICDCTFTGGLIRLLGCTYACVCSNGAKAIHVFECKMGTKGAMKLCPPSLVIEDGKEVFPANICD